MRKKSIFLTLLISAPLLYAAYQGYEGWKSRWRASQNVKFDTLEHAYAPSPVDLRGKNVLSVSYNSMFKCDDACGQLLNGGSGAQVYYAVYDFPEAPDFSVPLDLTQLAQGRVVLDDNGVYGHERVPFSANETPPAFDYVLIEMQQAISPVLTAALPDFDLAPELGVAERVFSPVTDQTAFHLDHKAAHFIQFYRSGEMGWYNSWQGSYMFPTKIDRAAWYDEVALMFCAPDDPSERKLNGFCLPDAAQ